MLRRLRSHRSRSAREDNRGARGEGRGSRSRGPRKAESGYKRLFINLGKADGFYPGEVMQFVNKNVHGKQAVGHIDLLAKQSYIEVPEQDAQKVMQSLDGATYKGRKVRCNDAEEGGHGRSSNGRSSGGNGRLQAVVVVTAAVAKAVKSLVSARVVVVASLMIILLADSISSRG